jgi:hypothetical protein
MPNSRNDPFGLEHRSISFNQSVNFFAMARSDGVIRRSWPNIPSLYQYDRRTPQDSSRLAGIFDQSRSPKLTASGVCNNSLFDGYRNLRAHAHRLPLGHAPVFHQSARAGWIRAHRQR